MRPLYTAKTVVKFFPPIGMGARPQAPLWLGLWYVTGAADTPSRQRLRSASSNHLSLCLTDYSWLGKWTSPFSSLQRQPTERTVVRI